MDMDRRAFLKGAFAAAATAAVVVPAVAEAKTFSVSSMVDWEHADYDLIKEVERKATADIMAAEDERFFAMLEEAQVTVDKAEMVAGDRILITGADNAADNGVYEVTSSSGDGEVTIERAEANSDEWAEASGGADDDWEEPPLIERIARLFGLTTERGQGLRMWTSRSPLGP